MRRHAKILILILTTCLTYCAAAQDDVDWYQSFFTEEKPGSIERALNQRTNELKKASSGDQTEIARILNELALLHITRTYDFETAMDYLIKALVAEDSLGLQQDQVFTLLAMAELVKQVGDYAKAEDDLKKALSLSNDMGNFPVSGLVLNELGKIEAIQAKSDDALTTFQNILEKEAQIGKPKIQAEALFNVGRLYTSQAKFKAALSNHKKSLAISRSIGDKGAEARSLNDIGELYRLMKNPAQAKANHVVAMDIRQAMGDKGAIAESLNNIAILYFEANDYTAAIENFQPAVQAARESQNQHQLSVSYEYLSECYEALGDFKTALEYEELFVAILELIQGETNQQRSLSIQNRYSIEQKQAQIDMLELDQQRKQLELERQMQFNQMLYLVIAFILIIAGVITYFYMRKRRDNKILEAIKTQLHQQNIELQQLNGTKDKFFSIISHDLKGPLNSLSSFSNLLINYTDSLSKEEIQMFAKDFDKSLKNLFALLENLLEWSRSQTGNIDFTPERFELIQVLNENKDLLAAQAQTKQIQIQRNGEASIYVLAHRNSINTVVRNLVSNAIKFTAPQGKITISGARNGSEAIISVVDTGVGMPPEVLDRLFKIDSKHTTKGTANEKGTGLGLILCKEFVEKNGGRISVSSREGEGTAFSFSLPLT